MFRNIFKKKLRVSSILTMMEQHIKSFNKNNLNYDYKSELSKLKKECKELENLGLSRTANIENIRRQINSIYYDLDQFRLSEIFMDFISYLSKHFDCKAILISHSQFWDLCKKYNLKVSDLECYSGFIPNYAIQSIKINDDRIKNFRYKEVLNTVLESDTISGRIEDNVISLYKIIRIDCDEPLDYIKVLENHLNKQYNIVRAFPNKYYSNRIDSDMLFQYNKNIPRIDFYYIDKIHITGYKLNSDNLLVAYKDTRAKESSNSKFVNHLVFQITPFGVIIYSMWNA